MESVESRVKQVIARELGVSVDGIKPEASFVDDFGADSLDQLELVMAIEDEFDIEIEDKDAERVTTVQQAINYIASR